MNTVKMIQSINFCKYNGFFLPHIFAVNGSGGAPDYCYFSSDGGGSVLLGLPF